MPSALLYLGLMLSVICLWFMLLKRPIYEAVLISFLLLLTITGNWSNLWSYIDASLSTSLLYSMVAFVAMSILLTKTKIIDSCIGLILSVFGRFSGGAGYAAVIGSAFMGALSGSGPGNVMATGALTIPAMKRSGFPAELAANIESNASYLGNMIPPSSNIVAAMGAFAAICPDVTLTTGRFWLILWVLSFWFILQRLVMIWVFCKRLKLKPMDPSELPGLRETLKTGWRGVLLPVVILLPFILDYLFKDSFFAQRLGAAGAKAMSGSVLLFAGGLASIVACLLVKDKKTITIPKLANMFSSGIKSIVPAIAVCLFGYMIGQLFSDLNVSAQLETVISSWQFGKLGMVIAVCLISCFLGMVIPGSSLVVIFGPMFISVLQNVGVDPLLAAAMLPCICGVMCGITPPLALGMYAGMAIAGSDYSKTVKNDLWWVAFHFLLEVVILMGWLPVPGL